ncbi:proline--tRNA ligase [Candidatus Woesearchaeota archaeon]|nr:proline--tRNA ligase [Candidatus Woesearchaeota archaeon]|tara:strand:- start:174 stop:1625 length:1452 start_codon:yes stop_codon:yes gene_type:complete
MTKESGNKSTLGITANKKDNFSDWYTQVIQKAELIDYSDVSGCMVLRPYSYEIWETIVAYLDPKFKEKGVKNAYFPLLIPEKLLNKEKDHIEGFAPEVAWVTHGGNSKLPERLAIRPTSETIMYNSYAKWIRSYRDLPLLINQWCNVVRWEFKHPVPFLRTREFLWQEGHCVHATHDECHKFVLEILDIYEEICHNLLAIPVFKGTKSEKEKFAGALTTTSIETFFPNGKAIQVATSHNLGDHFAKAFNVKFMDKDEQLKPAWQNSWGITTRSIGIMIGMHGDNKGLIIPPKIAPIQAVIIPIHNDENKKEILTAAENLKKQLKGIRIHIDDTDNRPGWKYNQWEMKGVPIRIELGPKDLEKKSALVVRRDTGTKEPIPLEKIKELLEQKLEEIQENLFQIADKRIKESVQNIETKEEFLQVIKEKKIAYALWCGQKDCEEILKDESGGAKSLNIPFNQKKPNKNCIFCNKEAEFYAYFAKSY